MSRVSKTICDCCGNELKGGTKLNRSLFLTVISGSMKTRADYCYECGKEIAKAIIAVVKEHRKDGDENG